MLIGLIVGLGIGLLINYISLKKIRNTYKEYVETFKELAAILEENINLKDIRINLLSEGQSYYKQGYEDTIKQNIELKKKLGRRTV